MAENKGLQIDLDAGEGQITKGHITDFIRDPCTKLNIEFNCKNMIVFDGSEKTYFRFLTLEWIPYSCRFGHTAEGTWWYHIEAMPKQMFNIVDHPCLDMKALASVLGVELNDASENLPIKCPVINVPVYSLMRIIRLQSYNDAAVKRQMGESYFLYCNSQSMTAMTWNNIIQSNANSLEIPEGLAGSEIVTGYDARVQEYLMTPAYPGEWVEEDYLGRFCGITIEMNTLQPAMFAQMYTIKFSNNDQMDSGDSMLCFYTDCDLINNNRMINRYSQVTLK